MARLYTQEIPTGCEIKEINRIPCICTVVKESSFVNVAVSPLNAGETRVMITCVEKPTYKWNLQAWCDYSGRWETSGPTVVNIPIFIRLWDNCIVQGIKVVASIIKNQKLATITASTGNESQGLGTITAEISQDAETEAHVYAQIADTEETHTMAFVTNAAAPDRRFNLRVYAKSARDFFYANMRVRTVSSALSKIVPVRVSTKIGQLLQSARIRVHEALGALKTSYRLKVSTPVPETIVATTQIKTGVLRNMLAGVARVFTRNVPEKIAATTSVRTSTVNDEIVTTTQVRSTLIKENISKTAKLQVFLIIPQFVKKLKLQVFTTTPEIKLLSYIRSDLFHRFKESVREVWLSIQHHIRNKAMVLAQAIKTYRSGAIFASSGKTDREKKLYASTGAQRGITRNVEGIPLAAVATRKIYMGPVMPRSLYHTLFVKAYVNSIDTTIALLFSVSSSQSMSINVTAYVKRLVALRMIQWYLHHIDIGNEGMANEIVFDLGDVDPIGPVPPIPDEVWGGGYVDYPFKGLGYQTTQESSGYVSPDPEEWVRNARMFWERETEIFDESSTE